MTATELKRLIAQAKAEGWTELDLSGQYLTSLPSTLGTLSQLQVLKLGWNKTTRRRNYLTALPEELGQLITLLSLDLRSNQLTTLPAGLAQLTNLQSLDLHSNRLTTLPAGLAQLTSLQALDLSGNQLTILPEWLAQLTNIQFLDLSENELTMLSSCLGQLTNLQTFRLRHSKLMSLSDRPMYWHNLQTLDLRYNRLTVLPNWLALLTNLHSLYLGGNKLTELPDWLMALTSLHSLGVSGNKLTELPNWLAYPEKLPRLQHLYIGRNPLIVPPMELLGDAVIETNIRADIDAIRAYFRQLHEAATIYFYEAKVLIIGEGGAGKTSLARKLLDPACSLLSDEESTEGLVIRPWEFALPTAMAVGNYTANLWDFGGQEIYFATHQFFLTKRAVYILVADTRRQHTDFYTWLLMQETFGEDSPVLLVKNRNRQHGNSFTIENLPLLRERFPNLREIIELDLQAAPGDGGWPELLHHLQRHLLALPHIGQPRPRTWVAVREAVDKDERDIIPWPAFVTLCQAQGMQREDDIALLAEYLHNLGDILYFHEDPILRDFVILKPTWGLDAVYKVLDNQMVAAQLGQFSLHDLRTLWSNPIYSGYHLHLLRLMANFQLCYPLSDLKDTYIAPQLLTTESPVYVWDESENLQLRYAYPLFMPRGILSRTIVKLHQRIEEQRLVWRVGVILNDGYARAEILELRSEQQIRIRVSGRNKRDLLMEIVRALDDLHRGFPKLHFERLIPCTCERCRQHREPHFFALDILLERLAYRKETIECRYPPYAAVPIEGLLSEIGPWLYRLDPSGATFTIYGDYIGGDRVEGDRIDVGDISDARGIAVGRQAAATVKRKR